MPTLFLICGLPGSGKTTLAKELEISEKALRLCPDEWIAAILADPNDIPELDRLRSPVESVQWEVAKRSLSLGVNVILEWGFWSKQERIRYREEAGALGAAVKLYYLDASLDELWSRLNRRNSNLPKGTFRVTKENLEEWAGSFEPPAPDESPNVIKLDTRSNAAL
ncbi:MAG: kinase [Chloroflexi bacterium]|nr:kinase [Chloroflexota bacterium]MDL1943950.1 ATP-binding protein [Chloroflexi bacterium CFX2]